MCLSAKDRVVLKKSLVLKDVCMSGISGGVKSMLPCCVLQTLESGGQSDGTVRWVAMSVYGESPRQCQEAHKLNVSHSLLETYCVPDTEVEM